MITRKLSNVCYSRCLIISCATMTLYIICALVFIEWSPHTTIIRYPIPASYTLNRAQMTNTSSTLTDRMDLVLNMTSAEVIEEKCLKQVYTWLKPSDPFYMDITARTRRTGEFTCPRLRCDIRVAFGNNLVELESSDIIFLFYKTSWDWNTLMQHRKSHQKWVFWTSESPRHTDRLVIPPPPYANVYDYAMTYRTGVKDQGAVMLGSYGEYHDGVPSDGANKTKNWAENKSKMVAWVSTNCYPHTLSWKRTEFVRALSRLVDVDIYGRCGNRTCGNIKTCGLQKYKFYLAFENSECRDYITEKFWQNSLGLGLVPIVYGARKEDYLKVAPPNSFIFLQDFKNLTELADYLLVLDRNDTLYNQYFEWRKHGSVTYHTQFSNFDHEYLCSNVVKQVLEDEAKEAATGRSRTKPVLPNLTEWWANSCQWDHTDFPIFVDKDLLNTNISDIIIVMCIIIITIIIYIIIMIIIIKRYYVIKI